MVKRLVKHLKARAMDTKLFWRLYFWWGIRQARKRRIANEARIAAMPKLSGEEWWEQQKKKK